MWHLQGSATTSSGTVAFISAFIYPEVEIAYLLFAALFLQALQIAEILVISLSGVSSLHVVEVICDSCSNFAWCVFRAAAVFSLWDRLQVSARPPTLSLLRVNSLAVLVTLQQ